MDHEPEEDFAEFYRTSADAHLRAVYASVGDRALAEDLTAEAFARAYASWRKVSRHPAPKAWVVRTALNTHVSWWRRRRRELPGHRRVARRTGPGTRTGVGPMTIEQEDQNTYDDVRAAFGNVSAPQDTQAVVARGRVLRRRRHAMPALAAAGVVVASLGLSLTLGTHPAANSAAAGTSSGPAAGTTKAGTVAINVDNAAFSVHTDAKTGYLTVTMRQFTDPTALEAILNKAGIRADIQVAQVPSYPRKFFTGGLSWGDCRLPAGVKPLMGTDHDVLVGEEQTASRIVLDPSAIPAGDVLGIGYARRGSETAFILVEVYSGDPGGCLAATPASS